MSGENLDISSEPEPSGENGEGTARPFIGIQFTCCQIYARVYLTADGTAYRGHCPRCGRRIEARIGPNGQEGRFFTVG